MIRCKITEKEIIAVDETAMRERLTAIDSPLDNKPLYSELDNRPIKQTKHREAHHATHRLSPKSDRAIAVNLKIGHDAHSLDLLGFEPAALVNEYVHEGTHELSLEIIRSRRIINRDPVVSLQGTNSLLRGRTTKEPSFPR